MLYLCLLQVLKNPVEQWWCDSVTLCHTVSHSVTLWHHWCHFTPFTNSPSRCTIVLDSRRCRTHFIHNKFETKWIGRSSEFTVKVHQSINHICFTIVKFVFRIKNKVYSWSEAGDWEVMGTIKGLRTLWNWKRGGYSGNIRSGDMPNFYRKTNHKTNQIFFSNHKLFILIQLPFFSELSPPHPPPVIQKRALAGDPSLSGGRPNVDLCHCDSAFILAASGGAPAPFIPYHAMSYHTIKNASYNTNYWFISWLNIHTTKQ